MVKNKNVTLDPHLKIVRVDNSLQRATEIATEIETEDYQQKKVNQRVVIRTLNPMMNLAAKVLTNLKTKVIGIRA